MKKINIKVNKRCVTCKYWHDPALSYIVPDVPKINLVSFFV